MLMRRKTFRLPDYATLKQHNILIEPWQEYSQHGRPVGARSYRWTVAYGPQRESVGQGFADSHGEAREAAENFLAGQGVDLNWQPTASDTVTLLRPRRPRGHAV